MQKQQSEARDTEKAPQQNRNSIASESRSQSGSSSRSYSASNDSRSQTSSKEVVAEGAQGQNKIVRYKYCCKICKHPDKSKRACVCVVPLSQRRADLGTGCRNCGCLGCSKEDFLNKGEDPEYHPELEKDKTDRRKLEAPKRQEKKFQRKRERSNSRKKNKNSPKRNKGNRESSSRSRSPEYIDSASMKFYNFDRSLIGSMIINEYQVNPILLGFGIPQRTHSYVFGRPR